MSSSKISTYCLFLFLAGSIGCNAAQDSESPTDDFASHAKGAPADYERIFDDSVVHRIDITIEPDIYQQMEDNMTDLYGVFGEGSFGPGDGPGGPGGPGGGPPEPPQAAYDACVGMQRGDNCSYEDQGSTVSGVCMDRPEDPNDELVCMGPPPGGSGGPGSFSDDEPNYFPVTIQYDGDVWEHVGMRYKGNSSLHSSWPAGNHKLPFRLDFDEFEDDYPEIDDQRFWGFKKLTFASNFRDDSFLREKVCADLFREAGVPAARGAFYRVFVDHGDGPLYWGLYTMVEDPSNKMLDSQFADDGGNLYKPEGEGADWRSFSENGFAKKTNEEEADWRDVEAAITALHTNGVSEEAWRAGLEATFNVDNFLTWLAIHVIQQNWDAYGRSPHNYYLYGDPSDDGRLVWIPWDLNEAMTDETSNSAPLTLALDDLGDRAPLISYLMDDPVYSARYREELRAALEGPYALEPLHAKMTRYHDMIAPYVTGPDGEQDGYTSMRNSSDFTNSLRGGPDALIDLSEKRHDDVNHYLSNTGF